MDTKKRKPRMKMIVMPTFKLHYTNYFVLFGLLHGFVFNCSSQALMVIGNWSVTKACVYLVSVFPRNSTVLIVNLRYLDPNQLYRWKLSCLISPDHDKQICWASNNDEQKKKFQSNILNNI